MNLRKMNLVTTRVGPTITYKPAKWMQLNQVDPLDGSQIFLKYDDIRD